MTRLLCDSYLAVIKNSVGANMFRNFYAVVNGKKKDITKDGKISCAYYASTVLAMFGLIERFHGTVDVTVKDMQDHGWEKTNKPKAGCVIVWGPEENSGTVNRHIGFYIGDKRAVSNCRNARCPKMHHWTFGVRAGKPKRKIEAMFWHKWLLS